MIRFSPLRSSEALKRGMCLSTTTIAFMKNAVRVSFVSGRSARIFLRNASSSVMSASSNCVTCGIVTQLRCRLRPDSFWILVSGWIEISPNCVKSISGSSGTAKPVPVAVPATDIACFT